MSPLNRMLEHLVQHRETVVDRPERDSALVALGRHILLHVFGSEHGQQLVAEPWNEVATDQPFVPGERRDAGVRFRVRTQPVSREILEPEPTPSTENWVFPRSHLVDALGKHRLGFLLVGADRFPALASVWPVITDTPVLPTPNEPHGSPRALAFWMFPPLLDPCQNFCTIEPEDVAKPITRDFPPPRTLVHPSLGHVQQTSYFAGRQEAFLVASCPDKCLLYHRVTPLCLTLPTCRQHMRRDCQMGGHPIYAITCSLDVQRC